MNTTKTLKLIRDSKSRSSSIAKKKIISPLKRMKINAVAKTNQKDAPPTSFGNFKRALRNSANKKSEYGAYNLGKKKKETSFSEKKKPHPNKIQTL